MVRRFSNSQTKKGHDMGGSCEKTLPATKSGKTIGSLRAHINAGEVHFHDDTAGKKCALSVADYHAAMADFRTRISVGDSKTLIGIDGKTTVKIRKIMNAQNEMDAELEIQDISIGSNFQMLEDLAAGK